MAGMSVGGLVSGLDTQTIISQLMQIEALPQTALKNRSTQAARAVTALQSINTRIAALQAAAEKLTGVTSALDANPSTAWNAAKATSSSTAVTATASSGALPGSVTFDVTALASAHFVATDPRAADTAFSTGPITITHDSSGDRVTITPEASDIHSVVEAINGADAGVRATALQSADGQYRLQITSTTSGAAGGFDVKGLVGKLLVRPGADAVIDLGGGLTVTSATGVFADIMPGTSITVSTKETGVRVDVAADRKATVDGVKAFVDAANAALAEIKKHTLADPGGTSGVLVGDGIARQVAQQILGNVSSTTQSPAAAGLSINRSGELTLDTAKLEKLLASDPAAAQALVNGAAGRLIEVAKTATGKDGTITTAITRRQESVRDFDREVESWDRRLELRRANLERTYSQLEVALGSLQQQSSWLSGQLAGLPSWSS